MLHEESHHLGKALFKWRVAEQRTGEEETARSITRLKGVEEVAALREHLEETVETLQIGTTQERCRLQLVGGHILDAGQRCLATVEHLHDTLGQLADGHLETDGKRVFVAVAKRTAVEHTAQEGLAAHALKQTADSRMLRVVGHKPVAHEVEEGEALHLRETAEVDVGALLVHVGHTSD